MGLETEELLKLRSLYEENARQAAAELLKEENIFDWTDELPFQPGDTIVALGSSTTDDLQGWFTILKHVLDIALDDPDFKFINAGMPNNTTTDALRRINRELLSHEPDWVFVDLGLFDAQRLSYTPSKTLIPLSETWEYLTSIDDVIETITENPPIGIVHAPVIPGCLDEVELSDFDISDHDLSRIRMIITGKRGYIGDPLGHRMGNPPEAWYYLSDGISHTLSGHVNTVKETLKSLATAKVQEKK